MPSGSPVFFTFSGAAHRACRRCLSGSVLWLLPPISRLAGAYGAPNFNTLLALHSANMEESTEILTIFPWYNYVVGLFIFALGVIAVRRKPVGKKGMG